MNTQKEKHLLAKVAAVMLLSFATVGGTYSVQAAGLTGSYVGISAGPKDTDVIDKGAVIPTEDKTWQMKIIDYRQTFNTAYAGGSDMFRTPKNNNENGEGVDGTSGGVVDDNKNVGKMSIGFGAYAGRNYTTAIGTYSSAIMGSTALGAGTYAGTNSAAVGRNTYANSSAVAMGVFSRADNGVAIGSGASAGRFYKYLQNDGNQNYGSINYSMAIGNNAKAVGGIAIGANAQTNGLYGVALGQSASVAYSGTALGTDAKVYVSQGVALGPNSVANRASNTIGYVPFADDGGSYVPKNISGLATAIGASDSLKAFNTKYANQITEYNKLNRALYDAQAKAAEQENIMVNTKGSANEDEQNQYTAAKALKEQYNAEAVAATKALNEWVAQNQDFATDLGNQKTELGTFKSTGGAVSVGSTEYDGDGRVSYVLSRQITNVAAGTEDTDAVNVAQLKRVANATISDITVGADKASTAEGLAITSDADQSRIDIVGANDNITTSVDADKRLIQVGLSNELDLSSDGSITFGDKGTTLNNSGLTIAAPADGSTSAITITAGNVDMGGNVVKNIGDGSVAEGSTDAINGGQIFNIQKELNTSIENAGKAAKTEVKSTNGTVKVTPSTDTTDNHQVYDLSVDTAGTSVAYTANSGDSKAVTLADGFNFTNGTNTTAAVDEKGVVKFNLNDDITLNSVTSNTISVGGKVTINQGGINMGGTKITNIGEGSIAQGSTDAVTGNQLYNVQQQITKITGPDGSLSQKANTNLDNLTDAGKTVITDIAKDAAKGAVTVKSGDDFIKVGLNEEQKANGVNQYDVSLDKDALRDSLGTGTNTAGDKNLITGDTLNKAIESVVSGQASDDHIKDVAQKSVKVVDGVNTTVTEGKDGDTKTYAVNVSDDAIKTAVKPELDQKANVDGSNLTAENINNWKSTLGVTNLNSDVSQVTSRVDTLESDVSGLKDDVTNLNGRVSSLNDRVDKVGAGAAALAGLHPLEFNPEDKFSASAALGNYKGDNAVALGAFYRPNADTMFSFGTTISDEKMFNVGVSFKFGNKGDRIYRQGTSVDVSALTSEVNTLRQENQALASQVNSQKAELEQQRALIQQLMNKVGM